MLSTRRTTAAACTIVVFAGAFCPAAAEMPARGMFLVATDEVRGPFFRQTVVLLLQADDTGAMGLVINRPMQATPVDLLPDLDGADSYDGTLYWGGPVQITSVRALLRSADPPPDAVHIVDEVYLVPPAAEMPAGTTDARGLRYFLGYAGWGAGQLDGELLADSWHVTRATSELVFDADTEGIWRRVTPPAAIRAARPLEVTDVATKSVLARAPAQKPATPGIGY